jgi:hypothetical protein
MAQIVQKDKPARPSHLDCRSREDTFALEHPFQHSADAAETSQHFVASDLQAQSQVQNATNARSPPQHGDVAIQILYFSVLFFPGGERSITHSQPPPQRGMPNEDQ